MAKLDHAVFDALNHCDDEDQLDLYSHYLAADLEVYHGLDGLRAGRKAELAHAEETFCGKQSRELVHSSIKVYPIEGYGAVETGWQRFCSHGSFRRGGTVFTTGCTEWRLGLLAGDPVVERMTRNVLERLSA